MYMVTTYNLIHLLILMLISCRSTCDEISLDCDGAVNFPDISSEALPKISSAILKSTGLTFVSMMKLWVISFFIVLDDNLLPCNNMNLSCSVEM